VDGDTGVEVGVDQLDIQQEVGKGTVDEVFRNPAEDVDIDAEEADKILNDRDKNSVLGDLDEEEEECSDNSNRD
jgi:hypothetical protein